VKPGFLMRRALILLAAGPLAGLAALSSSSSPIAAAAVTHGSLHHVSGAISALVQSSNWSGVAVTGGSYTRATGSWVVPTVKVTTGNRYAADWVGIGGYSSGDLIQAGTSEEIVGGHTNYYAWTEILPAPEVKISGFVVHPGDSMTVDVAEASLGAWTITVSNHTTAQVFTKNLSYASTNSSAEWIHEAPTVGGTQARLASTSAANFDHGTVNGSIVIGSAGTIHEIQLVGATRATPSGLDSDHDGFRVADGSRAPRPPAS
jgi:hypothetical protein